MMKRLRDMALTFRFLKGQNNRDLCSKGRKEKEEVGKNAGRENYLGRKERNSTCLSLSFMHSLVHTGKALAQQQNSRERRAKARN